ncbi:syntenin-2-like [Gasterosteus aculeatus]
MSLYPSLEDLKVDKVMRAQAQYAQTAASMPAIAEGTYQPQLATAGMPGSSLYPDLGELGDYMGLALNSEEVQRNLALLPVADNVSGCVHPNRRYFPPGSPLVKDPDPQRDYNL